MRLINIVIIIGILLTVIALYWFSIEERKMLEKCDLAYRTFTENGSSCDLAELFCRKTTNVPNFNP